jgi:hypothetical protein
MEHIKSLRALALRPGSPWMATRRAGSPEEARADGRRNKQMIDRSDRLTLDA